MKQIHCIKYCNLQTSCYSLIQRAVNQCFHVSVIANLNNVSKYVSRKNVL